MARKFGFAALIVVFSLGLVAAVAAAPNKDNPTETTTSINNGGNNPNCGNSCDDSHNPGNIAKPCTPVPGNGCHRLPATPCDRGHNGTKLGNKHCGPDLAILKEQENSGSPDFTDGVLAHPWGFDLFYRVTVSNFTDTAYTLVASDPLCDNDGFAHDITPSGPQIVPANSDFEFFCDIDAINGAGLTTPGAGGVVAGAGTLTNTVTVVATPAGGSPVTLTDSVTATITPN